MRFQQLSTTGKLFEEGDNLSPSSNLILTSILLYSHIISITFSISMFFINIILLVPQCGTTFISQIQFLLLEHIISRTNGASFILFKAKERLL